MVICVSMPHEFEGQPTGADLTQPGSAPETNANKIGEGTEWEKIRGNILEQWRSLPEDEKTQVLVDMFGGIQSEEGRWKKVWRSIVESTVTAATKEYEHPLPTLTTRQYEVLSFIEEYIGGKGFSPALDDIRGEFDFTSNTAAKHVLGAIERKGYIRRERGIPRSIQVLIPSEEASIKDIRK